VTTATTAAGATPVSVAAGPTAPPHPKSGGTLRIGLTVDAYKGLSLALGGLVSQPKRHLACLAKAFAVRQRLGTRCLTASVQIGVQVEHHEIGVVQHRASSVATEPLAVRGRPRASASDVTRDCHGCSSRFAICPSQSNVGKLLQST
jgi:hypothetical protein